MNWLLNKSQSYKELIQEMEDLRSQLEEVRFQLTEANDIIDAIRSGEVDTLVVKGDNGHQLYTLKSTDHTYRIFIEQMTEGALTLNREGIIQYCNSKFATMVNLPLEKVIGSSFFQFVKPQYREQSTTLIRDAWEKDMKSNLLVLNNEDDEMPVLLSLKTLNLDEGYSMSIIVTDLSGQQKTQRILEQKNNELLLAQQVAHHLNANLENTVKERTRALENSVVEKTKIEEELRSNQERLTSILETMAEGISIVDTNGNITYANPLAQQLLRLQKTNGGFNYQSDLLHFKIDGSPIVPKEHPTNVTIATGQPVHDYEISIRPTHNDPIYISVNAAPIRNNRGSIVGAVSTFMDVTNRRIATQQKDEFLNVASHELRTPITSLKVALQLLDKLKNEPTSELLPRLVDQANKSLNKVSILVSDLLDATKITDGQLHVNKKNFSLHELLDESFHHIHAEGIYKINIEGADMQVDADPDKIDQVLINLVNNAMKYASASKKINVTLAKTGDMAKVELTDYGPGISPDKIPYLFDRYFRADNSDQYSGLGLGLYICAEIIKKHGGEIGVVSTVGEGSTFWFTLPLAYQ